MEEKVIFVAATQIFADSVEQDLKGHISKDFRIIVKDKFTEMIRESFTSAASLLRSTEDSGREKRLRFLLKKRTSRPAVDKCQQFQHKQPSDSTRKGQSSYAFTFSLSKW